MSLRARLIWLVLALAIPLVAVGGAGLYQTYLSQQQVQQERLHDTARALSLAADREIDKAAIALDILSRSVHLVSGDLETFYARAQLMVPWPDTTIVLFTPDGDELFSTAVPYGTPTIRSPRPETVQRVAISRKVEVSGVFIGARTKRPVVSLTVPVILDGRVRYVLRMGLDVNIFQSVVTGLKLPSSWLATLTDRDGKVLARSQEAERFLGQPASETFQRNIRDVAEGTFSSVSLSGVPVIVTHSRSPGYGLAAAVSYPQAELQASIRQSLGWGAALLAVALGGVVTAAFLVRDIVRPISGLLDTARTLGAGRVLEPRYTGVQEVDQVENALAEASRGRFRAAEAARESDMRLRLAVEAGQLGAWEYDPLTNALTASALCKAKFGRGADEPFTYEDLLGSIHPEDREHQSRVVADALARRANFAVDYRVIWPDGSLHWVEVRGGAAGLLDSTRLIGVSQEVTASKTAEARQELLLGELNHRVKNTLATVQSIATMTRRSAPDTSAAWDTFDQRVRGMSKTHDLLTASNWESAFLKDILSGELDLYQDALRQRVTLRGKPVRVGPKATLALGLAIHELATNAAKYGGLSVPEGRLSVRWSIVPISGLPHLLIEWLESGGPAVTPPKRQGFGSRLLQRSLALELEGDLKIAYEPHGLRCVITFPLHSVEEARASDMPATNVLPFPR